MGRYATPAPFKAQRQDMTKSDPTLAYSAIIVVLTVIALIWSRFSDPVDLLPDVERLDTASLLRDQSVHQFSYPPHVLISPSTQSPSHELTRPPAPIVDSAQMLRDRSFSDGYVSPSGPTVIAGPAVQKRGVGSPRPISSRPQPPNVRKWVYVHSSSCAGLRSRRAGISEDLRTLRGKLPDWRRDQLRAEYGENLERQRLGLCR